MEMTISHPTRREIPTLIVVDRLKTETRASCRSCRVVVIIRESDPTALQTNNINKWVGDGNWGFYKKEIIALS